MAMGMTDITPVATNTTLIHKKFPVDEETNNLDYINKYKEILDDYEEIFKYQTKQINNIKEKTNIHNLDKLYILYEIYNKIDQTLFEFKQELSNETPQYNKLLQLRSSLIILFDKLLSQMSLYLSYIYNTNKNNKTKIEINKKDLDKYDMLIPSDKKDWLVNRTF